MGLVAFLIIMCVLPFPLNRLMGEYFVEVVIILLINIILVVSYRLMTTMGYWSLGHVVSMGVGAYAAALLVRNLGWSFWAVLPIGGLTAALVMLLLSYPLVRMRGFAFFIGSFAAGEAIRLAWIRFRYPFGGTRGLINIPPPSLPPVVGLPTIDFWGHMPYYFLVLAVTGVSLFIMYRIDRSQLGDTLKAIESQEVLAQCVGVNIARYKTIALVIAAFFAGMAGVLLVHRLGSIDPHLFIITVMLYVLIWVVVGGTHTFFGPIIGVSVLTLIDQSIRIRLVELVAWRPLFLGVILILFLLFMPEGLESLPAKVSPLVKRLRSRIRRE